MPTPYGWDRQEINAPKYVSREEWTLTGSEAVQAFWPMKLHSTSLDSGAWGKSGLYRARQLCVPYNDISGMSGCIGVSIRKIRPITQTGLRNQNIMRRQISILHEGYCYMEYKSGTLDGTPVTLRYGDLIAPCTSGFRAYQELNFCDINEVLDAATGTTITEIVGTGESRNGTGYTLTTGDKSDQAGVLLIGNTGHIDGVMTTGNRQTILGIYADVTSNLTGTWKKVKVQPHNVYGAYP